MIRKPQNDTFREWILNYDAILWKVARAYAPSGEHEDLHQDLLIAAWHALPLFREQAKPSTFIYRVALNCALNWTRGRQRYQKRHVELPDNAVHILQQNSGEQERRVEQLYAALAQLPEADRSLALLHLDELSYREIAEVLGITENNVGVKLNRVKKRLIEQLQRAEQEAERKTK